MFKKVFKFMFIAMLAFSLVGLGVSTSFAKKPENLASKSQACEHASENAIFKANPNSVLADCGDNSGNTLPLPDDDDSGVDILDRCLNDGAFFQMNREACFAAFAAAGI